MVNTAQLVKDNQQHNRLKNRKIGRAESKFLSEEIMGAQNVNSAPKFPKRWGFSCKFKIFGPEFFNKKRIF